jgi:hypothetical protein
MTRVQQFPLPSPQRRILETPKPMNLKRKTDRNRILTRGQRQFWLLAAVQVD